MALILRLQRLAVQSRLQILATNDSILANFNADVSQSWTRGLSSNSGGDEPPSTIEEEPTPAPSAAEEASTSQPPAETTPEPKSTLPTIEDLAARGYSKRQAKWILHDPASNSPLPRLSRKEKGSFADPAATAHFNQEIQLYPTLPQVPLYNLQEVVPEMLQSETPLFDKLQALKDQYPDESIIQIAERAGLSLPSEEQPPFPGAKKILQWESSLTFLTGTNDVHPIDRKVKLKVHLRDLGEQTGVTLQGLEWIAEISGQRYNPKTGVLTLTCDKHEDREDNRRVLRKMLDDLVEEGRRVDGVTKTAAETAA